MNPLKLKASGTPITSANFQGLQVMTDTEIKNYIANKITAGFSGAASNGSNTADINVDTANALTGTSIGTFVDYDRDEATGTHPATGASSSVTYYAKQVTASASESISARAIGYDTASGSIKQLTDAQLGTDILDKVITAMVTESAYTSGQYRLASTAPSGGTWTSRYTITDVANGGNTTYYIWQKTAATSSPDSDLRPLKAATNNVTAMTDAEIQQMVANFRNRIISTSVGTYKLQASTPSPGTWVSMGSAQDTREAVASQNYSGTYAGNRNYAVGYTGSRNYSTTYTSTYAGSRNYAINYTGSRNYATNYTSTFAGTRTYAGSRNYAGNYTSTFAGTRPYAGSRNYAGNYTSNYSGTRTYAGNRNYTATYTLYYGGYVGGNYGGSRNYSGNYVSAAANYSSTFAGSRNYATNYTGGTEYFTSSPYAGSRNYSASYVSGTQYFTSSPYAGSRNYSGSYAGSRNYAGNYSSNFAGSRNYSGSYAGSRNYAGNYTGTYAGDTIQATKDVVSTVSLWIRTA